MCALYPQGWGDSCAALASQLLLLASPCGLRVTATGTRAGRVLLPAAAALFLFPPLDLCDGREWDEEFPPAWAVMEKLKTSLDLLRLLQPGFPPFRPSLGLCLVGGCKNSALLEFRGWQGRAGRGPGCWGAGPVSPFPGGIREATCCQECLAGRGKRRLRGGEQASAQMEI